VLGWVAERYPQLVRDIAARGHEIACHGFSHRLVYEQITEEFYEETLRAKNLLEDITGSAVNRISRGELFHRTQIPLGPGYPG